MTSPRSGRPLRRGAAFVVTLLVLLACVGVQSAMAETDPVVDTTFGTDGALVDQNVPAQSSANDSPQRVVIQPDGKILVAAYGAAQIRVVRYLHDGTPDPAFGTNGIVTVPTGDYPALGTILLRPDGRILVVASVWRTDNRNLLLVSLTAAGKADHNFSSDGQVETDLGGSEWARDAVLFADGSVVVAGERGELGAFPPSGKLLLVRYLKSGSIDKSFGSSGSTALPAADNPHPRAITVDRAGRFLVVGEAYDYDTGNLGLLARFTPAGKPDPTFRGGGVATIQNGEFVAPVSDVVAEPDGTIVVAGYGGQLGRYSRDGELLVRAYNVYGGVIGGGAAGEARFVRQSDGGLIVVTTWDHSIDSGATNYDIAVVRFTPDLNIDQAFAPYVPMRAGPRGEDPDAVTGAGPPQRECKRVDPTTLSCCSSSGSSGSRRRGPSSTTSPSRPGVPVSS